MRSASNRLTVSRDVPTVCAISCVSLSFTGGSALVASPFFAHHSSSNAANLPPAECASPKARISWRAELYLSLKLLCDLQAGVIVLIQEAKEIVPFREVDLTWIHV